MKKDKTSNEGVTRREFVSAAAATAAAFTIVPRHVLGGPAYKAPSDKLNVACVGIGGKGFSDSKAMSSENVVALCDVDEKRAAQKHGDAKESIFDIYPKARFFRDFRVMLDEIKDIEAITISTPDHTHAVIALEAMKRGIHVFVQKPMTHTIYEAQILRKAADKYGVITQMGNQGHAGEGGRKVNEWIWDGAIGDIEEVYCWTNRPIWPQGIEAPTTMPSVPPTLDWDLWLGPAAWRPYHPSYVPFAWRGFWDFGTGAIGDMGAHILDHAYWPLKLEYPEYVQATSTPYTEASAPQAELVTYDFPARNGMKPVRLTWIDGGFKPPRPLDMEQERMLGDGGGGVLFLGSKGNLMCSVYGRNPRIIPEAKMRDYLRDLKDRGGVENPIPRSPGITEEWLRAIKEGKKEMATTNFDYSGPLTETMLMGNVAVRVADENKILEWDRENGKFANSDRANDLMHMEYRKGWDLSL